MNEPTGEQPSVAPTVSTAPAQSRWSKLPSHLGRARTSTLVLALLFLAIGALYLNIRPPVPGTAATTSDTGTGVQQPAEVPATEPAPETTAEPTTSAPETTSAPTSTSEQPTTETPTRTTTEPEPTSTSVPTITSPSRAPTSPTAVSPTG